MQSTDVQVREMVHKRHRRRRTLMVSLVAASVVGGAALLGVGLVRAANTAPDKAPSKVPADVSGDKAGLLASEGAVRVDIYLDYLCPECRNTESELASELKTMKASGEVRVTYHPVAFLDDRSSPEGYSTRAASAAACAADQGEFIRYSAVLFDKQPPEGAPGLSEAQLVEVGRDAGVTGDSFEKCVRDGTYTPWVRYVSDVTASRKIALTPTVTVNGRRIEVTGSDPAASLARAVKEARE
ncbi:DsbA family protein [Streptomyces katsurahamanus]|uniref:Disulfide bond formation protein DsbA n=1 Tax=Streptomyces katsurahamanus TaxID=2577098 RepID=A0ABW9NVK6_9ACTN|nr:thioredoxin domain-containing protein [Streptomyces katsurahamanus]MQS37336.1 disulfide bond formation protein DsbA [Streptomyces katsurahamanus]